MANRLATELSPYLLQHKDNPVDWYPWGDEAFRRAREEGKPIFLSVGYSSCHWCHVMEEECFEDEQVAHTLNTHFINIKVDREERPDVDEAYMTAVHFSSGRGGWPMSVFMTPDKEPFFAGTYFPKMDRGQIPGFLKVISQIALGWSSKRDEFVAVAKDLAKALREAISRGAPKTFTSPGTELLQQAVQAAQGEFDQENGGFGSRPKFPSHTLIEFLLTYAATDLPSDEAGAAAVTMSLMSLRSMALGGIRDHVGGGFHRYSTDEKWRLPHFEKMLYDNAMMLRNYARATRMTIDSMPDLAGFFANTAGSILAWLERDMRSPEGLYYSAIDADSEGEEGRYYVWTESEIRAALGEQAEDFIAAYNISPEGNYEDEATRAKTGANILYLSEDVGDAFAAELDVLLATRDARIRPLVDDKCVVSWNGLLISGLAEAGEVELGEQVANGLLEAERQAGELPHHISRGTPAGKGFLDDYAALALGLYDLGDALDEMAAEDPTAADRRNKIHAEADRLVEVMIRKFYDESEGGFYFSGAEHEELFGRTKPPFDQPIPSGNGLAVRCLIRKNDFERAQKTLEGMVGWIEKVPTATNELQVAIIEMNSIETSPQPVSETESPHQAVVPDIPKKAPIGDPEIRLDTKEIVAGADGRGRGTLVIDLPDGLHVNGNTTSARWLSPTVLTIQPLEFEVDYPPGEEWSGQVKIPFDITLPASEKGADFEVEIEYQACTDTECREPSKKTFGGVILKR